MRHATLTRPRSLALALGLTAAAMFGACRDAGTGAAAGWSVIGGPGRSPGRFVTPRGLALAAGRLWVVDRSGRVQGLSPDGRPEKEIVVNGGDRGFPIGVLAEPDGGFVLCDTHASVVRVFDADGRARSTIGAPGTGIGGFTYPQHAARAGDGRLYVSEFGRDEANRVQVFEPDGRPAFAFGSYGMGPGQFTRAMGIVIAGDEVFVADVSDRIQVFGLDGAFRREFGRSGTAPGELRYPYGMCLLGRELVVCEYANNRLQRFDLAGRSLGCFGRPGAGAGEFSGPWDVAAGPDGRLYVADAGNHRVVVLDPARLSWRTGDA